MSLFGFNWIFGVASPQTERMYTQVRTLFMTKLDDLEVRQLEWKITVLAYIWQTLLKLMGFLLVSMPLFMLTCPSLRMQHRWLLVVWMFTEGVWGLATEKLHRHNKMLDRWVCHCVISIGRGSHKGETSIGRLEIQGIGQLMAMFNALRMCMDF